jgi:Transglycosylase SLT domain
MAFPGVDRLAPLLVPVALVAAFLLAREQGLPPPAPRPVVQHKPAPVRRAAPAPRKLLAPKPSVFAQESAMSYSQLVDRWNPLVKEASRRFNISGQWIRAVIMIESGGKTMLTENRPIISRAGAMGLMQLMPETWREMRRAYALGPDPYDPHDNIMAGAATLSLLYQQYGYPTMFAAYNDGPGMLEAHRALNEPVPAETASYVRDIASILSTGVRHRPGSKAALARLTRPDGAPVMIDASAVMSVRPALPGEYAPSVRAVVNIGRLHQGVRETVGAATTVIRSHGGLI